MELRTDENYWLRILLDVFKMRKLDLLYLQSDLINNHYEVYKLYFREVVTKQLTILDYDKRG